MVPGVAAPGCAGVAVDDGVNLFAITKASMLAALLAVKSMMIKTLKIKLSI